MKKRVIGIFRFWRERKEREKEKEKQKSDAFSSFFNCPLLSTRE